MGALRRSARWPISARRTRAALAETPDLLPPITDGMPDHPHLFVRGMPVEGHPGRTTMPPEQGRGQWEEENRSGAQSDCDPFYP